MNPEQLIHFLNRLSPQLLPLKVDFRYFFSLQVLLKLHLISFKTSGYILTTSPSFNLIKSIFQYILFATLMDYFSKLNDSGFLVLKNILS